MGIFLPAIASSVEVKLSRPLIGAIRWDAWSGGDVTEQVEKTLGPMKYHARLPWFAEVTGDNTVRINGNQQQVMEQEIGFAADAGLNYWAFLLYREGVSMSDSLKLYLKSESRHRINFCIILHSSFSVKDEEWPKELERTVALLKEPGYQKVLDDRPLVYAFDFRDSSGFPKKRFDEFCKSAQAMGVNPYFVFMGWNPAADYKKAVTNGFSAVSHYAYGSNKAKFKDFCQQVENDYWKNALDAKVPYVPLVTTGWDKNPRKDNPVSWERNDDYHKQTVFPATATPAEIAEHLDRALTFVREHPDICHANTIIMYAWNENDEGGWLVPTWKPDGKPNTERLDTIKKILK